MSVNVKTSTGLNRIAGNAKSGTGGGSASLEKDIVLTGVGSLGALKDGDTLNAESTFTEVMEAICRKRVLYLYKTPTTSLTLSSTLVEAGQEVSITITPSFRQNDAGDVVGYDILKDGVSIFKTTGDTFTPYTDTFTVENNPASISYNVEIDFTQGPLKQDNFGEDQEIGRIEAGTANASKVLSVILPFYYSSSSSADEVIMTKDVSSKSNKTYLFNIINSDLIFKYDATYPDLTSIVDSNGFEYMNSFTKVIIDGYKVYTMSEVTVSDFALTFKF